MLMLILHSVTITTEVNYNGMNIFEANDLRKEQ